MHVLSDSYDVVIVGGGLVGASLALLLSKLELDVLVVEKKTPPQAKKQSQQPPQQNQFDARSTALSLSSKEIYQSIGVWQNLQTCTIETIHTSQRGRWGATHMHAADEGLSALGYVVENQELGRVLLNMLDQVTNITWCAPATLAQVTMKAQGASISIDQQGQQKNIDTQLLVLADGARSHWCQRLGILHQHIDYQQTAVIANVEISQPHAGQAFERFTATAPMALLPLTDCVSDQKVRHRMALVWVHQTEQALTWMKASDEECLERLQQLFAYQLGEFRCVGERVSFPLQLSWAKEQVRRSLVVMGNAAHALHPVAGQGFNLALRDCLALTQQLELAAKDNLAIGELQVLQAYYEQQKTDQARTIFVSDRLPKVFASNNALIKFGRQVGLLGLDVLPALRTRLVKTATGID